MKIDSVIERIWNMRDHIRRTKATRCYEESKLIIYMEEGFWRDCRAEIQDKREVTRDVLMYYKQNTILGYPVYRVSRSMSYSIPHPPFRVVLDEILPNQEIKL